MIKVGEFHIDPDTRTLRNGSEVVRIGSRAFDILVVLAKTNGRLVTKRELMDTVWPDTIVEENNIHVHLSKLRLILGPHRDLIRTVPGRGYQLAVTINDRPADTRRTLPAEKSELLGRDRDVIRVRELLETERLVTLVGPGGVGKTRLAIESVRSLSSRAAVPVYLIELDLLKTKAAVLAAITESCELSTSQPRSEVDVVASAFNRGRCLLLLDNAEHLITHVAEVVEALIAVNPLLQVLVTSREPLRIAAETLLRVQPLDVPSTDSTDETIIASDSVKLFFMRAHQAQEKLNSDTANIQQAGDICRRLDGNPLAIELAAGRVAALGIDEVSRRLSDYMGILTHGYRTALPRHKTMRATFDWSIATLDDNARLLFGRLAVFEHEFTFDMMCAALCDERCTLEAAIDGIDQLVAKSLVSVAFYGPVAKYRLSCTTRAYAMYLLNADEQESIASSSARTAAGPSTFHRPAKTLQQQI